MSISRQRRADILLTTPESLEVTLISRRIDHRRLFANLRFRGPRATASF